MGDVLLEGIRASIQPCSLALLVPGIGLAWAAGRMALLLVPAYVLTAAVTTWAQASLLVTVEDGVVTGVALAGLALMGAGGVVLATWREDPPRWLSGAAATLGGVLVGLAAASLWQPCVGEELGAILTAAPDDPGAALLPMVVYQVGLLVAMVGVAALPWLHDGVERAALSPLGQALGLAPVLALMLVLVTGAYGTIIGQLVQRSSLG